MNPDIQLIREALEIFESPDDGSDAVFGPDDVTTALAALSRLEARISELEGERDAANLAEERQLRTSTDLLNKAAADNERLRAALERIIAEPYAKGNAGGIQSIARQALEKEQQV